MPLDASYRPLPRIELLGDGFFDPVEPARFPRADLRFRNQALATSLGLGGLDDREWEAAFARFEPLLCNLPKPLALRYHGHQFGTYNPQLGDGRGFLHAQLLEPARPGARARLIDLGTKGSGRTPWSRSGDGRLTLKGAVREILATEMLETLGVPTSRTLSVFETGEALHRGDEPSPTRSAVLVRASFSHLRFGTFQRLAALEDAPRLAKLVRYAARHYFDGPSGLDPEAPLPELAAALLARTAEATARMVAAWMAAGFVHGVLNTDNFTITGESFDYGPWRFIPTLDPSFVAAYFDHEGRYAFGRQPAVGRWNLARLGDALAMVCPRAALADAEARYDDAFPRALGRAVTRRLGLRLSGGPADVGSDAAADVARAALAEATFAHLAATQAPFERFFFDAHAGAYGVDAVRLRESPSGPHADGTTFDALRRAAEAFEPDPTAPPAAGEGPETLLVDDVEAIWAAIDRHDDFGPLDAKVGRIRAARAPSRD